MSVNRSQRVKNMFAAPKTADLVPDDPATPVAPIADINLKGDEMKEIPLEIFEVKIDDIIKAEDPINDHQIINDIPLMESPSKPPIKKKGEKKVVDKPTPPENEVIKKEKDAETTKFIGPKVYIGCRVSNEMKNTLENMAKDFAYLARKEYGLKIKDDSSSIQRAFLLLGMSCFTEKVRHKALQEYDPESPMQEEVSQQLLALMRIHNVEINDIDF